MKQSSFSANKRLYNQGIPSFLQKPKFIIIFKKPNTSSCPEPKNPPKAEVFCRIYVATYDVQTFTRLKIFHSYLKTR
jgi:hypothetical protein